MLSLQSTFKSVKAWIQELRTFGPQDIVIAIAGNKCDLEDLREVTEKGGSDESSFMLCGCPDHQILSYSESTFKLIQI